MILVAVARKLNRVHCKCGEALDYTDESVQWDNIIDRDYVECPECGHANTVSARKRPSVVTVDNVKFPRDFDNYNQLGASVSEQSANSVEREIQKGFAHLGNDSDKCCCWSWYGCVPVTGRNEVDPMVFIFSESDGYSDGYWVIVAERYAECYVKKASSNS